MPPVEQPKPATKKYSARHIGLFICCGALVVLAIALFVGRKTDSIILGILAILLGIFGVYATWKDSKCLLILLLIGAAILGVFAIISFILSLVSFSLPVIVGALLMAVDYVLIVWLTWGLFRTQGQPAGNVV